MAYSSTKLLWQVVTEQSLSVSDVILENELQSQKDLLKDGLAFFKAPTKESRDAFVKKRGASASAKLPQFILQLSQLLHVEEELTKQILSAYLAGEFRGTKQSLKSLIEEERFQRPLLLDIWQFYRVERLHLLQVLKEILTHHNNADHPHSTQFKKMLKDLDKNEFEKSILSQLESALDEDIPSSRSHGPHFNDSTLKTWAHFSLREQADLLQILLLHIYSKDDGPRHETFKQLSKMFLNHGFGNRQKAQHLLSEVDPALVESIGFLESLILTLMVDLPGLSAEGKDHRLWKEETKVAEIDKIVVSLGAYNEHGPVMLAWMLAHFLVEGESSLATYHKLGERALEMEVVSFLTRIVQNTVVTANSSVKGVAKGVSYGLITVLLSAFEANRMSLDEPLLCLSKELLLQDSIAADFWKQGLDVGLGSLFGGYLSSFPLDLGALSQMGVSLATASPKSAEYVLSSLYDMDWFAEHMDLVPSSQVTVFGPEQWKLTCPRPISELSSDLTIPCGTTGIVDGRLVKWKVTMNGWSYLSLEIQRLSKQIASGMKNVNPETVRNVLCSVKLLHAVLANCEKAIGLLRSQFTNPILDLAIKFVHLPNPPPDVLAFCLRCLSYLAKQDPMLIWKTLGDCRLFPFVSHASLSASVSSHELNCGLIGSLLAQQECVNGEYPLTFAFIDLLSLCIKPAMESASNIVPITTSIAFLAQDILPSFQRWRFSNPCEKEVFGQKMLLLLKKVLSSKQASPLKSTLQSTLNQAAPLSTLIKIIGMGDKVVQSAMEAQSSWEAGLGVETAKLINLAMNLLEVLLLSGAGGDHGLMNNLVNAHANGNPHLLLVITHYIYHVHSVDIPVSAMKLLTAISGTIHVSLLACLGNDAPAIRDILLFRLESKTENEALKVAILNMFSSCLESQPGFVQLLIDGTAEVVSSQGGKPLTKDDKAKNEETKLVSDASCLTPILALLKSFRSSKKGASHHLHKAVLHFFLGLWQHQSILALSHLKKQPNFWDDLTWPLLDTQSNVGLHVYLFRILAIEIFTFAGQIDSELKKTLETLCDANKSHLTEWNNKVLDQLGDGPEAEAKTQLLNAWKSFLTVLSKDQPVSFSPKQCNQVASKLIGTIRLQLKNSNDSDNLSNYITSLGEMCFVVMQRWLTKCSDNMEQWCKDQALLLEDLNSSFDKVHPRARAAILGIANTALKMSNFKLKNEEDVLVIWLEPATALVQKALATKSGPEVTRVGILAVNLLRNLISRMGLSDSNVWFSTFHRQIVLQTLLGVLSQSLRQPQDPAMAETILGLLVLVVRTSSGCRSLLTLDLSQMIWMPLSEIRVVGNEWKPTFHLAVQLVTHLLRTGKHDALENSITVVALLQDQLTSFLMAPRSHITTSSIDLTVETSNLISLLMKYFKEWNLQHRPTLLHFYQTMTELIHLCVCLLLRPSLLSLLVDRQHQNESESLSAAEQRVRRISSTDQEVEVCTPETAVIQNSLLDALGSGLAMLRTLSPDLVDLFSGNLIDVDGYEELLGIGFSSPTFEQKGGLTYGTLISLSNVCIRSLTRSDLRSPSPALQSVNSGSTSSSSALPHAIQMDHKRLILVLEQSLVVMLAQSLLSFAKTTFSSRDKQLLRRELGAEFSSCIESMRRYVHRGTKSPVLATKSGGGSSPTPTRIAKTDEQFMKVIANIVTSVFN